MVWNYKSYSSYRKEKDKVASKYFLDKGYDTLEKKRFILKENKDWDKNIILEKVSVYIKDEKAKAAQEKRPFPLHDYLHHGLSSQAMIFNLFGDVVINRDFKTLNEIFNFQGLNIYANSHVAFEHCDRVTFNEKQQQPTSFDFVILNKSGKNVFVESKFVETEFGNCSQVKLGECDGINPINDENLCYLTHKGRKYWELMIKHKLHKPYEISPICPFSIYYQFFRELLFALENNGYYVLLIDRENPAFIRDNGIYKRGLIPILIKDIPNDIQSIIKIIFIQDVLEVLEGHGYLWVSEFREKYGVK